MTADPLAPPAPTTAPRTGSLPTGTLPAARPLPAGAVRALVLATLGFGVSCWAWALLSPLGPVLVQRGTVADASLVVAIPVLVGAVGRIPIGALTDRFGGRIMFPAVSLAAVVPVLFLGLVGQDSLAGLLLGGLLLGIAGTIFAIGIPFVNSWFPPERRGMATGIYGASMGGTAIAAFTTVPLVSAAGPAAPFLASAAALVLYAGVAAVLMRPAPGWRPSTANPLRQTAGALRLPITWQTGALYALSFGGYVAFTVFLPTLLVGWYELSPGDAALRTAGFVVVAVILRPFGGVLADRFTAARTLLVSYAALALAAGVLMVHPPLAPWGTAAFLLAAGGLGLGAGAVFALVARVAPPQSIGAVTGVVGAAGGLGGFVPPLLMAASMESFGTYGPALAALLAAAVGALALTAHVGRRDRPAAA
ncbi:MFS transporter [Brachybacterium phenoliresistens]|uniref:MFS transporter n=1 Tax=Brachybacterium phenoliresistens TaxID=396014 RepID=UPI0031D729BE